MTTEQALIKLGTKGADVVLAQMKKIENAKSKLAKTQPFQIAGKGLDAFQRTLGMRGGVLGLLGKGIGAVTQPREQTEAEKALSLKRKESFENNRLIRGARNAGRALEELGRGAAGLDPTSFLTGVAQAAAATAGGIPILSGLSDAAAKTASLAVQAASGAVQAAKASMAVVVDTQEKKGIIEQFGAGFISPKSGVGKGGEALSLSEKANLIESVFGRFGKMQQPLADSINRLFAGVNNRIDPKQFTQVAAGNFTALGTDKGFFFQKISDAFSGLPPSVAQKAQSQLLNRLAPEDFAKDRAENERRNAAFFDTAERTQQERIFNAYAQNADKIIELNNSLNSLQVQLISTGAALTGVVNEYAASVVKVIGAFPSVRAK